MWAGIFLERFLLVFAATLWGLYLLGAPASIIGGVGALMLAVGAGYNFVHGRRTIRTGPHHGR